MSSFTIKLIAIITMIFDHIPYTIPNCSIVFHYIGRISFPLFAFQITQGYMHTKDIKKYILRLFILAIISQIPFLLLFEKTQLNIFFTLILGIFGIFFYEKSKQKLLGIFLAGLMCLLGYILNVDYGVYGVLTIFLFYLFKNNKLLMNLSFIFITFLDYLDNFIISNFYYPNILMFLFNILPLIFINAYNGQKGKNVKYLFYIFYPLHLIILYIIKLYLN